MAEDSSYTIEDHFEALEKWKKEQAEIQAEEYDEKAFDYDSQIDNWNRKSPNTLYYDTAGEIEARETERRSEMTAEERRQEMPWRGGSETVFAENGADAYSKNLVTGNGKPIRKQVTEKIGEIRRKRPVVTLSFNATKIDYTPGNKSDKKNYKAAHDALGNDIEAERNGFGKLLISKTGFKHNFGRGTSLLKMATVPAIKAVFEKGKLIYKDKNHNGKPTFTFAAKIKYDNHDLIMAVEIEKTNRGIRYYQHEVYDEKGNLIRLTDNGVIEVVAEKGAKKNSARCQ